MVMCYTHVTLVLPACVQFRLRTGVKVFLFLYVPEINWQPVWSAVWLTPEFCYCGLQRIPGPKLDMQCRKLIIHV